jgi:hypothetical protein
MCEMDNMQQMAQESDAARGVSWYAMAFAFVKNHCVTFIMCKMFSPMETDCLFI